TPLTICYCYHLDTAHFLIHTSRIVLIRRMSLRLFFFNDTAPTEIYTLSLHDALPILLEREQLARGIGVAVDERRRDDVGEHPDPMGEPWPQAGVDDEVRQLVDGEPPGQRVALPRPAGRIVEHPTGLGQATGRDPGEDGRDPV